MNDNTVFIDRLECFGRHGVLKEENELGQKFIISAELETARAEEDEVECCVNYAEVCRFITSYVRDELFKLIETLADRLALEILLRFEVGSVRLRIDKPWAPVGLPFESVGVEVFRRWHRAYISFGSNMGDRKAHIDNAAAALRDNPAIRVDKISKLSETEPYGGVEQESFLNGCMSIYTLLEPYELLAELNRIEALEKRERLVHWGPRTLDLDILLYDELVMNEERLTIPHIDMHNRLFVLEPLCELAPYARHSAFNKTAIELLTELRSGTPAHS